VAAMSPSTKIGPSQSVANRITAGDLYDGARYVGFHDIELPQQEWTKERE
jgi:hypothetical protein